MKCVCDTDAQAKLACPFDNNCDRSLILSNKERRYVNNHPSYFTDADFKYYWLHIKGYFSKFGTYLKTWM